MLFAVDDRIVIDATRGQLGPLHQSLLPAQLRGDRGRGRIFIEAKRKIGAGEELSYDYNLVLDERHTPAVKRAHACSCGARRCRGTLLGSKR